MTDTTPTAKSVTPTQYWVRQRVHGVQYVVGQLHFNLLVDGLNWVARHYPADLEIATEAWKGEPITVHYSGTHLEAVSDLHDFIERVASGDFYSDYDDDLALLGKARNALTYFEKKA